MPNFITVVTTQDLPFKAGCDLNQTRGALQVTLAFLSQRGTGEQNRFVFKSPVPFPIYISVGKPLS